MRNFPKAAAATPLSGAKKTSLVYNLPPVRKRRGAPLPAAVQDAFLIRLPNPLQPPRFFLLRGVAKLAKNNPKDSGKPKIEGQIHLWLAPIFGPPVDIESESRHTQRQSKDESSTGDSTELSRT